MALIRLIPILLAALLAACSGSPTVTPQYEPPPDERPEDFTLAVTVLTPRELLRVDLPRSLRPARYIIEADGALRAAVGPGAGATTFPPRTRQLTAREFDGLWRQLRETALLDPGHPARVSDPETVTRAPDRTTALIYVSFEGTRRTLRVLLDRSSEDAVAAERLVDRLAELAWMKN